MPLFQHTSGEQPGAAAATARGIGKQYGPIFKKALKDVLALTPPHAALRANEYLARWLQFLSNACDSLAQASSDGHDSSHLRDTRDFLDDARYQAKAMGDLRQRLHDAINAPKTPGH